MRLTEHDIRQISIIDEQTTQLLEKNAPDTAILDALMDFIPEVKCMIEQSDLTLFKPYLDKYQGFAHFFALVDDLMF